jgi:hypothetical protein
VRLYLREVEEVGAMLTCCFIIPTFWLIGHYTLKEENYFH